MRRAAFARAFDSSQFVKAAPRANGAASVWPSIAIGFSSRASSSAMTSSASLPSGLIVAEPNGKKVSPVPLSISSMRRPSSLTMISIFVRSFPSCATLSSF
jgi:hypothetical protein